MTMIRKNFCKCDRCGKERLITKGLPDDWLCPPGDDIDLCGNCKVMYWKYKKEIKTLWKEYMEVE